MMLSAVEGAAGCGKTAWLISELERVLHKTPLKKGQRVLALTFMHGARRRLHDKLRSIEGARDRLHCVTIDSFAQRLVERWRSLARTLGVPTLQHDQYDAQCEAAGLLLEQPEVAAWVAASFPIVLVDEAQDLKPQRLRIVSALAERVLLLCAADHFQCLDQTLRPNPCVTWLGNVCTPITLTQVHRTSVSGLLAAAATIREGGAPTDGPGFKIVAVKGMGMAAAYLANAIAWRRAGTVAVVTPALKGGFAKTVVHKVGEKPLGKQGNGPYIVHWERSEQEEADELLALFRLRSGADLSETIAALGQLPAPSIVRASISSLRRQANAAGIIQFNEAEVLAIVRRHIAARRHYASRSGRMLVAMTVQQAKNREFDDVVVLWPYQVGGDAEHKRRLLYNAITRARRSCTVILQSESILAVAPFVASP